MQLTTELTCIIIVLGGISLIVLGFLATAVLHALLDKLLPERLERFQLDQYKQGVLDSATRIKKED